MYNFSFDETFWVGFSVILFIAIVYRPVKKAIINSLDNQSYRIRKNLEDAKAVAGEAQKLLDEYKLKQEEVRKEISKMMKENEERVKFLTESLEAQITENIEKRSNAAMSRISQHELAVLEEVRREAIQIAVMAVKSIVRDGLTSKDSENIINMMLESTKDGTYH